MKSKILLPLSISAFLFTFYFVLSTIVSAQSPAPSTPSTGLALTPPTFELSGNPGEILKNTVKLENMHPYPVEISVDRRNFTAVGEDGAVGLTEEDTSFSLASWIEVFPSSVTIPPKSSQHFTFTVKIPLQAEPGGHFGSLVFRTIPTEKLEGSGASLAQEIGSLVLLRLAGETVELSSIESFTPDSTLFEYGPISFTARLKNQGNVHTKPHGTITITNLLGQQVATVTIEPKNILPGATRKLSAVWDTKWRLGRYTATLTTIDGDNNTRSAVTTFTVIPYRLFSLLFLILLFLFFLFKKYRTRLALAWKILSSGKA